MGRALFGELRELSDAETLRGETRELGVGCRLHCLLSPHGRPLLVGTLKALLKEPILGDFYYASQNRSPRIVGFLLGLHQPKFDYKRHTQCETILADFKRKATVLGVPIPILQALATPNGKLGTLLGQVAAALPGTQAYIGAAWTGNLDPRNRGGSWFFSSYTSPFAGL